ncbi:hypothetical protein CYXG_00096 [Synechococcus phage S-SSM4]|uniref:Uncharacterized protein n=1 Tax=Synechococcus phage S-SSM4 TaxID=536466 RepID=M1T294_9CAUD|nr:hypothetical protein CYXG_00096 [Synechococcus phage S-SSM4]AGG54160.1 hypothetical protein CYXG_00096 [Synechococcus phage S-SSM4]AGG54481.1 hypothetical protein CYWG_00197 [Cyanophage S-SSM6b]
MFILVNGKTLGVYAVKTENKQKVVQIFEERDDAERYLLQLEASALEEDEPLEIHEIDLDMVIANCVQYGYSYGIIEPDDLVIPPV